MFEENKITVGSAILTASDATKVYQDYEILESFHEQHEIDLEYTVLSVFPFHLILMWQSDS